ncbi:MAG TPA: O-antigen ligase family protein [Blastocatellia bacterium]|nr:O-antigen ligase family protein [Blastocatellia bacterium]
MKSKAHPPDKRADKKAEKKAVANLFEIAFLALPFLALIPNTFVVPPLAYEGLATQEFYFACACALFAGLGLARLIKAGGSALEMSREDLWMLATLALFILWQVISLAWAPTPYSGSRIASIWLGLAIFFTAGRFSLRERSAEWLFYALSVIAALLAASVIFERLYYGGEMLGIFFNHGVSAELLVTILPLHIIAYLTNEKRWLAALSLALSGLSAVALLMGLRRGAIIAAALILLAVGLALALKLIKVQSRARIWIAVGLFALAVGAVGARYRQDIVYRIQGATQLQAEEGGLTTRLRSWITAWEMGKSHALIGVGAAGYPSLYGEYRKRFVSNPQYSAIARSAGPEDLDEIRSPLVHNEYLETFVELGIVGLLLFLAFWAQVARALWRRARGSYYTLGALLGLAAFGVSSFTSGFSLRNTPQAFIVACVLSIGFATARANQDATDRKATIALPGWVALAVIAISLIAGVLAAGRNYNVLASQRLQGGVGRSDESVDFQFYPNNQAGNEALQRRYEQVIELDSENAGARLGYGLLLYQMKQPDKAIPLIEYALKRSYNRPFTYVLLAFAYEQTGDLARAEQLLAECLASFPQSVYTGVAYTEILQKQGKIEQSREQWKTIFDQHGYVAQSWQLPIKMKIEDAAAEAARRGLILPDQLYPVLARGLVIARSAHYLKTQ